MERRSKQRRVPNLSRRLRLTGTTPFTDLLRPPTPDFFDLPYSVSLSSTLLLSPNVLPCLLPVL